MEDLQFDPVFQEAKTPISWVPDSDRVQQPNPDLKDSSLGEVDESLVESMLCDSGSRLIPSGLSRSNSTGSYLWSHTVFIFLFWIVFVWFLRKENKSDLGFSFS